MLRHDKKAFLKFFLTYFGSIALLILVAGFFYFEEHKKGIIEQEHLSMIEYARRLKTNILSTNTSDITHKVVDIKITNFSMNNFKNEKDYFIKYVPYTWESGFIKIKKNKQKFNDKLAALKNDIIAIQVLLLFIFAFISYFLSKKALEPMQEAIVKLDNFSKDLIHDLNTPITSILLNIKILQKKSEFKDNKPLNRIKRNIEDISELHNNLTILLEEETMLVVNENIVKIIEDVITTHQKIYTDINYEIGIRDFIAKVNKNALKQVLVNLISNASKYNDKQNPLIKIYSDDRTLCIQDNGIGIKNPTEIFNRSYSEQKSGTGIGLDIVKRLCEAMDIEIFASSRLYEGTTIYLKFKN